MPSERNTPWRSTGVVIKTDLQGQVGNFYLKRVSLLKKAEWESIRQRREKQGSRWETGEEETKTQQHETDGEQREGNPLQMKPHESIREGVYFSVFFGREQPHETQMDKIKRNPFYSFMPDVKKMI